MSPSRGGMVENLRKTGIDIIGDVPWGTHFCQFYRHEDDLREILIPYFKAGLENNEFCMWVTSEPLSQDKARQAMMAAMPDFAKYRKREQIEIIPHDQWYLKGGFFDSERVLNGWVDKLNQALARGYDGLRLTGNTFWLERNDWETFTEYEEQVNRVIGKYQMIAICTYSLEKCGAPEVVDVVRNHQFALIKQPGKWEFIESSDYKKTREALVREKDIIETIMENTGAMLVYFDSQFNFVKVNSAYARGAGYKVEELIGKNHFALFPDKENQAIFEKVRDTGEPITFHDKPFIFPSQPERGVTYWDWTLTPVKDATGKVQGLVLSLIETTARVLAEQQLTTQERLATIGELAGGIAHELRNPLATIDSSVFYLSKALKDADAKLQSHLERIHNSVQRSASIIQSLVNLTRMQKPKLNRLDLKTVVSEAITESHVPASIKTIKDFPREKVVVAADWEQLQIAFHNIITNAIQAMPDGGTLTISIWVTHNEAELSFADTGPGIPPEYMNKLFTPLFTTKAQGIGFGLPIAKMIVERHGGTIKARSDAGKGATIILRLPLHSEEASPR